MPFLTITKRKWLRLSCWSNLLHSSDEMNVITSDDSSASWQSIVWFISICLALTSSVLFAALCSWQWAASRIGPYWSQLTAHMIIRWRRSPTSRKFSKRVDQNANFYHSLSYRPTELLKVPPLVPSFRFDGPNRQLFGWSIKTVKGVGEWQRWKAIWWAQTEEKEEFFFFFFFFVGSEAEYRSMLHIYWIPDNKASSFPMKVKSLMVRFFWLVILFCVCLYDLIFRYRNDCWMFNTNQPSPILLYIQLYTMIQSNNAHPF